MSTTYKQILIKGQTSSASTPQAPQTLEYKELATDINGNVYIGNKNKEVIPVGSGSIEQNFEQSNEGTPEAVNADTFGGENPEYYLNLINKKMDPGTYDPKEEGIDITIQTYTHSKEGTVHNFIGAGANGRALMTADVEEGDTFTVNGESVEAYMGTDNATEAMVGNVYNGRWITFIFDGTTINFKGGGGGKVLIEGLSAEIIKKGTTVSVKQGSKIIKSITGSFDGIQVQTQRFSFTIKKKTDSSVTIETPEGSTVVGMQKTEPGNRPPGTRVEMSNLSGNTATISYSNPFEFNYNAAGYILYTFDI